jgi:predicted O-methyltransferase YrrM
MLSQPPLSGRTVWGGSLRRKTADGEPDVIPYEDLRQNGAVNPYDLARIARFVPAVIRNPPWTSPGHYYSPLTNDEDAERAVALSASGQPPLGVSINLEAMSILASELAPMWRDLDDNGRYSPNGMYGLADAAVYHSILRKYAPQRVIEVGSGYSTAVALDTIDAYNLPTKTSCIEPNPERLRSLLKAEDVVPLQHMRVQSVPLETFDALEAGDILFIDSTHVVKAGSDVVYTTQRVLPRLRKGVLVHVHDIFWPFEYPDNWLRARRDWSEIYILHAFLSGNSEWRVLFFNDLIWNTKKDIVQAHLPKSVGERPGSLWLEKI